MAFSLIICFIISFVLGRFFLYLVFGYAYRNKLFDAGNERSMHQGGSIPRLGGLAFLPAMFFGVFLVTCFRLEVRTAF